MASKFSSPLSLFSVFLFSFYPLIQGEGHGTYHSVDFTSSAPSVVNCSSSNGRAGGVSLGLYHRYGPCAQPSQNFSRPSFQQVWVHDRLRRQALGKKVSNGASVVLPDGMIGTVDSYAVQIGLGTPAVNQLVMFDTGSPLTWVQCSPCRSCIPQTGPEFSPASSTTYNSVPCGATACPPSDQYILRACSEARCLYGVVYGDNATSIGELGTDSLSFAAANVTMSDFLFGCGMNQSGSYAGAAGLLGLSRHPSSIVNQTLAYFGGVFSYCLPASHQSTGHLTFGVSEGTSYEYVPMLTLNTSGLYYLNLTGISVGGIRFAIPEADFLTSGGTIIDSGSTFTSIPGAAYNETRDAFVAQMAKLNPWAIPENLDGMTCYNFTGRSPIAYPSITLHISGVAVPLSSRGIFMEYDGGISCLAVQSNDDPSVDNPNIIGYVNQRELEVVYDIVNSRIGFANGTCI